MSCSPDVEQSIEPTPVIAIDPVLRTAMFDEEDARGSGGTGIESLRQGLIAPATELQRLAVRAIGRLEDPELIPMTFPLLFSDDEAVRARSRQRAGTGGAGNVW